MKLQCFSAGYFNTTTAINKSSDLKFNLEHRFRNNQNVRDKIMGLISNGTTIFDAGAIVAGAGAMTFIKKLTASAVLLLYLLFMGQVDVVLDNTYQRISIYL